MVERSWAEALFAKRVKRRYRTLPVRQLRPQVKDREPSLSDTKLTRAEFKSFGFCMSPPQCRGC